MKKLHSDFTPEKKWFWQLPESGRIQTWDEFVARNDRPQNAPDSDFPKAGWWHCRALVNNDGKVLTKIDCMFLTDPVYVEPGKLRGNHLSKEPLKKLNYY